MAKTAVLQTLNDQATRILRERIISGEMQPGSRVLEVELAEELGISRGTLRSALQQLGFEGLVVQRAFRSTYVASLTSRDAYEVYTLRNFLEAMASRLVAATVDERARDELGRAIAAMGEAVRGGSRLGVMQADYAFHRCVIELSGHAKLQAAYGLIEAQTQLFLRITSRLDYDLTDILRVHRELADAMLGGDADRAERLARDHNTPDGEKMTRMLRDREEAGE